jgi:hypothetical protein
MLSKCANPGCSASFHYLHQGKLFRWDTRTSAGEKGSAFGTDPGEKKPSRRVEFFWLCGDCASQMTLIFDRSSGVTTQPLIRARGGEFMKAAARG